MMRRRMVSGLLRYCPFVFGRRIGGGNENKYKSGWNGIGDKNILRGS
jgi:hypothetical protein